MGSDAAPSVEVAAALAAVAEGDLDIILVGDEARIGPFMAMASSADRERVAIQHTVEVIAVDDAPASAVKNKKKASMRICFDLVKAGEAAAVVSAGNTGAMLACGLFVWGRLPGVERPAIVTTFPTRKGPCALLDMGANVDIRPSVLAQFAVLGAVYSRTRHKRSRPRVGLLSNGAEEHKGTQLTRQAHALLSRLGARADAAADDFEYVGYIEGRDIFAGDLDVVVTDGFTGNVVLKSLEGLAASMFHLLREEVQAGGLRAKLGAFLMKPALRSFRRRTDYAETGGAPLLGVEGVAMICHGGSDVRAMKNAILVAREFAQLNLRMALAEALSRNGALWAESDAAGGTLS